MRTSSVENASYLLKDNLINMQKHWTIFIQVEFDVCRSNSRSLNLKNKYNYLGSRSSNPSNQLFRIKLYFHLNNKWYLFFFLIHTQIGSLIRIWRVNSLKLNWIQHFKDMSLSQAAVDVYITFLRILHFYNIHFCNKHLIVSNDTFLLCKRNDSYSSFYYCL